MNSYVYAKTRQIRVDAWPDFDEWAKTVVAAVKTHWVAVRRVCR
jgi:hypothetical protein